MANKNARNPGIYIRHNEDGYYIGESGDVGNRDANGHGRRIAVFPASENTTERMLTESEFIQYCKAAGVPITNKTQFNWPLIGYELPEGQY